MENQVRKVLAFDFGASGGRVMICTFDGEKISMEEIHRFSNDPVTVQGTMYWDVLRLYHEIKQGLIKSKEHGGAESLAVDTWGVDFCLIGKDGRMLENPVHYRDSRTAGMMDRSQKYLSRDELYTITGNQMMEINTLFQLLSLKEERPELLERTDAVLLMPDLFHYLLSGRMCSELSIASTTQLMDAWKKTWSPRVLEAFGFRPEWFRPIVPTGTSLGPISAELREELGLPAMQVIAAAGHDTQCALAAVPAEEKDFVFLSSGTWSLLGTELDDPLIDENSRRLDITNECGFAGKTSFLKNIIGLWLIQESRRQWMRENQTYSFSELEEMAASCTPFASLIDPDDPVFTPAGDIPQRIRDYCRQTGQHVPQSPGEIVRCINESLAFKYRHAVEELSACTGRPYHSLYMIGGGTKSEQLCTFTANACGFPVIAGPAEATVLGNAAIQLCALGAISGLPEIRKIVRASEPVRRYEPSDVQRWAEAYQHYQEVTGC